MDPATDAAINTVLERSRRRGPAVFLDYDGVLTPIVDDPDAALLSGAMRAAIQKVAVRCPVAIVSGRDRADVRTKVGIDGLYYAGSHGWDISDPEEEPVDADRGEPYLDALDNAEALLGPVVSAVEGARLDRKRYAIAVHFRHVDHDARGALVDAVHAVGRQVGSLRSTGGKMIVELRPDVPWHKGTAVLRLLELLEAREGPLVPVYLGDDLTDEDALAAIRDIGVGVFVGVPVETAAHVVLPDVPAVEAFLEGLAARLPTPGPRSAPGTA